MKHLLLIGLLTVSTHFIQAQDAPATAQPSAADDGNFSGKVVETVSTAGYTYVLVDTGSKKLWAAAVEFAVKVGDSVTVNQGMPMANYHSKSLNRDFDVVYFTGSLTVNGAGEKAAGAPAALPPGHPPLEGKTTAAGAAAATLPVGHPPLGGAVAKPDLDLSNIKKAEGGRTIQEIYAAQATLAGQSVTVRGKVVKYNANILGKNWVHVRDGSGRPENRDNDLMVTTGDTTKLGDLVLVSGKVATNRDFGSGYKYSLMVEDAKLTVE